MIAKLLKHEWKANSGLLGVLSLSVAGISLLVTALLCFVESGVANLPAIVWVPVWVMIGGGFLAMAVYSVAVQIILLARFYKNKFTDEGYLTFTLPVTTHQILLSSLLNYVIWSVISVVVAIIGIGAPILACMAQAGVLTNEFIEQFKMFMGVIFSENGVTEYTILLVVSTVVSALASVMLVHTAIALGAVLAKKHKILAAFGCYYGFSMILSTISTVLTVGISLVDIAATSQINAYWVMNSNLSLQMVIYAIVAVVGYFLSHHLMKNKLNLP